MKNIGLRDIEITIPLVQVEAITSFVDLFFRHSISSVMNYKWYLTHWSQLFVSRCN